MSLSVTVYVNDKEHPFLAELVAYAAMHNLSTDPRWVLKAALLELAVAQGFPVPDDLRMWKPDEPRRMHRKR